MFNREVGEVGNCTVQSTARPFQHPAKGKRQHCWITPQHTNNSVSFSPGPLPASAATRTPQMGEILNSEKEQGSTGINIKLDYRPQLIPREGIRITRNIFKDSTEICSQLNIQLDLQLYISLLIQISVLIKH